MDVIGQLAQADLVTCLHVAEQALRRARQFPLSGAVADSELVSSVQRLEALGRMCTGQKLRLVAEIAERSAHRGRDAATTEDLLATTLHLSRGEAKAQAELAAGLVAVPKVAEALADGRLGVGQAQVTVRKAEELKGRDDAVELIAGLDATAARAGQTLDRGRLGRQLDAQIAREAPDALKTREQRAWDSRGLSFDDTGDGPRMRANFSVEGYAVVKAAIEALGRPDGARDPRKLSQRHHDALVALATAYLDKGELPQTAMQRPHVVLITTPDALHDREGAEPSQLDGVGLVSNDFARQLCCDSEVVTVTTDRNGAILDVGRDSRTATRPQRAAVIARDRACIGCGAPTTRCEVHHIKWFSDGGLTDLDNLTLVCWNCHRHIHHHNWQITQDEWGRYRAHPPGQPPDPNGVDPPRAEGQAWPPRHTSGSRDRRLGDEEGQLDLRHIA